MFLLLLMHLVVGQIQDIKGRVLFNQVLNSFESLSSNTRVILNGGEYTSYITEQGHFGFHRVHPGQYLMQVLSTQYEFHQYRLNVGDVGENVTISYTRPGTSWAQMGSIASLEISPIAKLDPFTPRQGFDFLSLFKNPMVLMMGVALFAMVILPKLTAGMPPEEIAEMKRKQAAVPKLEMPDIGEHLTNWLTSSSSSKDSSSPLKQAKKLK